jgi:hypothetical protein
LILKQSNSLDIRVAIKRKCSFNHGGRRPGAGRKPTSKRRQFIAVGLAPYLHELVIEQAKRINWRPSHLIEDMVKATYEGRVKYTPEEN